MFVAFACEVNAARPTFLSSACMDANAEENELVVGRPTIGSAEREEVLACLASGWLGPGPRVRIFEDAFARYQGVAEAAALHSCTDALHLALVCAGIGPGDEVITTPMTFCATVNAIVQVGATPVLADVVPGGLVIDPGAVEAAITPRTRGLLIVHFAGYPCDLVEYTRIASERELVLIEDCAHAIETRVDGRAAGTWGDFGCFSFHATKNVTTGEGGMVLARRNADIERIRRLRAHGVDVDAWARFERGAQHYEVLEHGYKCSMTDLQAALGIPQLARIESNHARRRAIFEAYDALLEPLPVERPAHAPAGARHAHHLYVVRVEGRDEVLEACAREGVGLAVHYRPIPEHRYYRERFGWSPDAFPIATTAGRRVLSLPVSPGMGEADVERVVRALQRALERASTRGPSSRS